MIDLFPAPVWIGARQPEAGPQPGDLIVRMFIPGPVVGKGRPRFVRRTGHAFTPEKTARYEAILAHAMGEAMAGQEPVDAAIHVSIDIYCEVPASWSKRKREQALAGDLAPQSKPDLDNVLKGVGDAGNGVIWKDDARITSALVKREFAVQPGLRIEARLA